MSFAAFDPNDLRCALPSVLLLLRGRHVRLARLLLSSPGVPRASLVLTLPCFDFSRPQSERVPIEPTSSRDILFTVRAALRPRASLIQRKILTLQQILTLTPPPPMPEPKPTTKPTPKPTPHPPPPSLAVSPVGAAEPQATRRAPAP